VKHRSKVGCGFSPMTLGRKGREVWLQRATILRGKRLRQALKSQ
jgi:hypothetical protein